MLFEKIPFGEAIGLPPGFFFMFPTDGLESKLQYGSPRIRSVTIPSFSDVGNSAHNQILPNSFIPFRYIDFTNLLSTVSYHSGGELNVSLL